MSWDEDVLQEMLRSQKDRFILDRKEVEALLQYIKYEWLSHGNDLIVNLVKKMQLFVRDHDSNRTT